MGDGKRTRRAVAAGVPATLLLAFANPLPAMALHQPDYPSWDEVEQARHDEAAAATKVEEIEGILIRLYAEAAELNDVAMQLGEDYALASTALDAAVAKVDRLKTQADAAQQRAEESERRVGVIVAQLARNGGGDVTLGLLLGSSADTESLLARLGTADRLSESSKALLDRAIYDKKTADALAADARAAERERQRLADSAQEALDTAQAAAEDAQAKADAQRADIDRMYAQLAALKGTTADLERAYREGQVTPTNPGPSPSPSTPPGTPPNPSPSPSTPTTTDHPPTARRRPHPRRRRHPAPSKAQSPTRRRSLASRTPTAAWDRALGTARGSRRRATRRSVCTSERTRRPTSTTTWRRRVAWCRLPRCSAAICCSTRTADPPPPPASGTSRSTSAAAR